MLKIQNLHASVDGQAILKGVDLIVNPGEVHAIMGPNGSGKSTLSKIIAGQSDYNITSGQIDFEDHSIEDLSPEERAAQGIFLGFQYPLEIPGVNNMQFLKTAFNSLRKARGESEMSAADFIKLVREKSALLDLDPSFLQRSLNEGFSGGEKKRNEILQLLTLDPKLAVLDETDSGLDIDALQVVSKGINCFMSEKKAVVLVTHYQRLLSYVQPDFVHVLMGGKIIKSGDKSLALELEEKGYSWLKS